MAVGSSRAFTTRLKWFVIRVLVLAQFLLCPEMRVCSIMTGLIQQQQQQQQLADEWKSNPIIRHYLRHKSVMSGRVSRLNPRIVSSLRIMLLAHLLQIRFVDLHLEEPWEARIKAGDDYAYPSQSWRGQISRKKRTWLAANEETNNVVCSREQAYAYVTISLQDFTICCTGLE